MGKRGVAAALPGRIYKAIKKSKGPTTNTVDPTADWQDIAKSIAEPFLSVFTGVLAVILVPCGIHPPWWGTHLS
jgi:hypothetical protein